MSHGKGKVPEGWEKKPLEQVSFIQTGLAKGKTGLKNPVRRPFLRVANVQDGRFDLLEIHEIELEESQIPRYGLQYDDVVITEGGDADKLGRGHIWRNEVAECIHQNHLFAIRSRREILDPEFLSSLISSKYGKSYFLSCAKQSTNLASINSTQLKAFPVLLPPLPEQRKIAAILSTWDDSLATLTNLLAAKRQQKRGLAEALLTGKKRLPGFEGEWRKEKLSKYVTRTKGKIAPTNKKGLGVPYIGAKSFGGNFEDFTEEVSAVICIREDVLILWDGEYAGNSTTGLEGAVSSTVARLRLSSELNPVFLQSFLQHDIKAIRESRTGSGIPHMPSDFEKWYVIPVPPLPEQQAIASILSALDGEIASLEALKAKVQEQKRGLMDELLTGRVRVKVEEAC